MNHPILDQIQQLRAELAPGDTAPALVTALADGSAPLAALAELAAQQYRIITSDRRSLLLLATRCADRPAGAWFATLADGESAALRTLPALAAACGLDPNSLDPNNSAPTNSAPNNSAPDGRNPTSTAPRSPAARPPLPGCQAYPAYLAWLTLNARPASAAVALVANFAAWGKCTGFHLGPGQRKRERLASYALVA
ncbi:hypothetical protein KV557_18765 [Kitasatospora aureofaciens]|uniref:hypothetical protein n=1 Tax=Kitasatospora aureofaciens TaxID=1894 RepID=UPI001C45A9BE|nr:hypothetical protein [Kitasatospora aureofaciens]MBV6699136.1 hypothetical protein [Kitasatospora aureofaciens]